MTDLRKPHKHAAVIKAWADGAEIECRYAYRGAESAETWRSPSNPPQWHTTWEYRVKPAHKWQKEIDAFAAGKQIQYWDTTRGWVDWKYGPTLSFEHPRDKFRIKPERVEQDVCITWVNYPTSHVTGIETKENFAALRNVRLTWEDGKLVDAKVLQ